LFSKHQLALGLFAGSGRPVATTVFTTRFARSAVVSARFTGTTVIPTRFAGPTISATVSTPTTTVTAAAPTAATVTTSVATASALFTGGFWWLPSQFTENDLAGKLHAVMFINCDDANLKDVTNLAYFINTLNVAIVQF
jgi:hypothetical protein